MLVMVQQLGIVQGIPIYSSEVKTGTEIMLNQNGLQHLILLRIKGDVSSLHATHMTVFRRQ